MKPRVETMPNAMVSLYVEDIHEDVTEAMLYDMFTLAGPLQSLHFLSITTHYPLRSAYVTFQRSAHAKLAMNALSFYEIRGRHLRITWSQCHQSPSYIDAGKPINDGCTQEKGEQQTDTRHQGAKVYVKNFDDQVDDERLRKEFSPFGTITSTKVVMKGTLSKCFGFVCFSSPEEANNAVEKMNGRVWASKTLYVALARTKEEHQAYMTKHNIQQNRASGNAVPNLAINPQQPAPPSGYFTTAVPPDQNCAASCVDAGQIGQVPPSRLEATQSVTPQNSKNMTDALHLSAPHPKTSGPMPPASQVSRISAQRAASKSSRNRQAPAAAATAAPVDGVRHHHDAAGVRHTQQDITAQAVDEVNGRKANGKPINNGRTQEKWERQTETRHQDANVYVKNFDDQVDDERLRKEFSPFGTITSTKVIKNGARRKCFGFVCFSSPEEANNAVEQMNGRVWARKTLYVALARTKEEHQAYMTKHNIQQNRASGNAVPNLAKRVKGD